MKSNRLMMVAAAMTGLGVSDAMAKAVEMDAEARRYDLDQDKRKAEDIERAKPNRMAPPPGGGARECQRRLARLSKQKPE